MTGGEGPWTSQVAKIEVTTPGVIIAGFNPVSTDAVATARDGLSDPRAARACILSIYCAITLSCGAKPVSAPPT